MLTLSNEKSQNTNNIWHSPNSKSNGIYSVEQVNHSNEHDAGSLSSSPLSSPDSKNMQPEPQQNPDATDTNFSALSRQSSPLSELTNLNDDDQSQDQPPQDPNQNQQSAGSSDSASSSSISNAPAGPVSISNGNADESRATESKGGLAADPPVSEEPAGSLSTNPTATLPVTSRQQQTQHQQPQSQPQQHTTINTSKSFSLSTSTPQQHHVNGMGVPSPPVRDYLLSTLPPPASSIYPSSSSSQIFPHPPNDVNSFKSSSDIPDEKAAAIFLLNVELLKVCMEFQNRQLIQTPECISYATRLQSNLTWLSAIADQSRHKNLPLPIMTPPAPVSWYPPHTINSLYQRLPSLFAKDIAKRQAAAALAANPGQGGGALPPGATSVHPPLSAGSRQTASGVPIQPAPPGMMAAGIKRGPPTDPLPDDQNGMRKRVDTGERRHSNPPLAATASPPHARSPSVMSNGTGVSVAGPGAGGMGMNNMLGTGMGVQDMGMSHQAQMQASLGMNTGMSMLPSSGGGMGMGGMPGMQPVQAHSPHSGSAVGHTSQSSTPLRSSPEVAITQQGQAGSLTLQGAQSHGSHGQLHHSQNSNAVNPQLGYGGQGLSGVGVGVGTNTNMLELQAQAQLAQRARMIQQAQAIQSNRSNPNALVAPGAAGLMKDPRMTTMMPNAATMGASSSGVANNAAAMAMNQAQSHLSLNTAAAASAASQMNSAASVPNSMNAAAGMSMQIHPPPHLTAQVIQLIANAYGPSGLTNYQALQSGGSNSFVAYMLANVPGFAHLPWQQQLQRMQIVQNNIRQQQAQRSAGGSMPQQSPVDQTNQRNGVMNPATPAHSNNQGHPQTPIDQTTVGSPFSRQSGSPPNVGGGGGGMQGMTGSRGPQMTPAQAAHQQHMAPPSSAASTSGGMGIHVRSGTAGSQSGSASAGSMNAKGMGNAPPSVPPAGGGGGGPGAGLNQNMTPQDRQLRLIQQQMHLRGKDGVISVSDAHSMADAVRHQLQHQAGIGGGGVGMVSGSVGQQQQQHQIGQGQIGMHSSGTVSRGPSSSAGSPPNTASGPAAPFGRGSPVGMNLGMGGMGGMGIGTIGGMPNNVPNRSAPSPSDMLSAAAAARGGLAPNMTQKRPVVSSSSSNAAAAAAMQNENMYHQIALYNQVQQRQQQQQQQQQIAAGFRPGTAMGRMSPATMAAAAQVQQQQQHQQQQQQQQQQYSNVGGGTINPGMIYGGGNDVGTGRVQQSHPSQQQAYLTQAQTTSGQMSQSQPPYHAISPAALQHHPDAGMSRIGTPGSVGGGGGNRMMGGGGGEPSRPGSSASNSAGMLPTDGLGGDPLESLFNWNGGE